MMRSVLDLWNRCPLRIGYSRSAMTDDERMQRESSLMAAIRRKLPDFVKAGADDTELMLLHQDALRPTSKRTNTRFSAWRLSTQVSVGKKSV
jgi:hypothetical protein